MPEIQVFEIDAKDDDVSDAVLAAIDKAVRRRSSSRSAASDGERPSTRMVAAHKQLGAGTPKLGAYFRTGWQAAERTARPAAAGLDLPASTRRCSRRCCPSRRAPGEELSDVIDRMDAVREARARDRRARAASSAPNRSSTARSSCADSSRPNAAPCSPS